jgi:hypothetical protein
MATVTHRNICQPIQALEHPAFKKMIDIAARATKGVKNLNRKQTREEIITLFRNQMKKLKDRLNVCSVIQFVQILIISVLGSSI